MSSPSTPLALKLWPAAGSAILRNAVLAVIGVLFVAGAAQVSIPMWPVPMTLQTLAVLGVGAAYGARLGAGTLALYAIAGLIGLPFFAGGEAGLFNAEGVVLSSGGYIIGFVLAAALVGSLAERGWALSPVKMAFACLLGGALLYIPGLVWLAVWAAEVKGLETGAAVQAALNWGLIPFIPGDILKAVIAGLGIGGASRLGR